MVTHLPCVSVIVPARKGSTRLPDKVLADIHGKPMVVRVVEQVLKAQSRALRQVVVATDHTDIRTACEAYGVKVVMTGEAATGTDRVVQAANTLGLTDHDCVVNVQGDEPLLDPKVVEAMITAITENPEPCATPVGRIGELADMMNPNIVKCVFNAHYQALYFSRAPIPFWRGHFDNINTTTLTAHYSAWRHYGVYAFKMPFLRLFPTLPPSPIEGIESLEQLRILYAGHAMRVVPVDTLPKPAVDTAEDLEKVRQLWLTHH